MKNFFMVPGPRAPLALDVAAVALPFFYFRFCRALPIGRERASDFHFFFELALLVAPNVTPVAFLRLDNGAFAFLAFFLCSHFLSPVSPLDRAKQNFRLCRFSRGDHANASATQAFQMLASLVRPWIGLELEQELPW